MKIKKNFGLFNTTFFFLFYTSTIDTEHEKKKNKNRHRTGIQLRGKIILR